MALSTFEWLHSRVPEWAFDLLYISVQPDVQPIMVH